MKKIALISAIMIVAAAPALAQGALAPDAAPPAAIQEQHDPVMEKISGIQARWAEIKYGGANQETQMTQMQALGDEAGVLAAASPGRPEPLIWQAIILSSEAGLAKGLSALPRVKKAKALLEQAARIDPQALEGSAYTSLGSLYYQVPGWPIGFGDRKKAQEYLKAALGINPGGIDPNYFYGDFLVHEKRYDEAVPVLEKALAAPDRPGRALADQGRRQEIRAALAAAKRNAGNGQKRYN